MIQNSRAFWWPIAIAMMTALSVPIYAQSTDLPSETTASQPNQHTEGPAIFLVRDDDTTIFFLGTTHVLPPEIQWKTNDINALFAKSSELILEVNDTDAAAFEAEMAALFGQRNREDDAQLLAELIWPENRAEFRKWAREFSVTAREMDDIPLWMFAFIYEYGMAFDAGATSEDGVESVLTKIYTDAGKPIGSIEAPMAGLTGLASLSEQEQIAPFNGILAQRRYVMRTQLETDPNVFAREKAWALGEVTEFDFGDERALLNDGTYRALIYDRNVQWADWIAKRMDQPGQILVAVGSAHLSGPHSVLRLLERRGFTVERLTKPMLYGP